MENVQAKPTTAVWLMISVVLVALNLRPSMAAVGPLLSSIRGDVPLSFSSAALLTMLPVMAMGLYVTAIMGGAALAASFSPWVQVHTGSWRTGLAIWAVLALLALVFRYAQRSAMPPLPHGQFRMGLVVTDGGNCVDAADRHTLQPEALRATYLLRSCCKQYLSHA